MALSPGPVLGSLEFAVGASGLVTGTSPVTMRPEAVTAENGSKAMGNDSHFGGRTKFVS
jgi:hypothetical protein